MINWSIIIVDCLFLKYIKKITLLKLVKLFRIMNSVQQSLAYCCGNAYMLILSFSNVHKASARIFFDLSFIRFYRSATLQCYSFSQTEPEHLIICQQCSKELSFAYLEWDVINALHHCCWLLFLYTRKLFRIRQGKHGRTVFCVGVVTICSDLEKGHLQWVPKMSCLGA